MVDFAWDILEMMLQGQSSLDLWHVPFTTRHEAEHFLENYGFNWNNEADQLEMHRIQEDAIEFIEKRFLVSQADWDHFWGSDTFQIPRLFKYMDLPDLMLIASEHHTDPWQRQWACAILKVMHLISHVKNSFYGQYVEEAREQILANFNACMFNDLKTGRLCLGQPDDLYLPIVDFQVKNVKTPGSSLTKLICKKESIAEQILDLVGVRIITEQPADAILVLEILRRNRVIIFANLIPSRSRNTLINLADCLKLADTIKNDLPGQSEAGPSGNIVTILRSLPDTPIETSFRGHNQASHQTYRAIHLTARHLIRLSSQNANKPQETRIYFPFEVQIMDSDSAHNNKIGDSAHAQYKRKQIIKARRRILGPLLTLHRQNRAHQDTQSTTKETVDLSS